MLHNFVEFMKQGTPPHYVQLLGLLIYMHVEWILPRTKFFKANSGLEALGNVLKMMLVHKIPLVGKALTAMATPDENKNDKGGAA